MKSLFLTRDQATELGGDLVEYASMKDSSDRDVIASFEIRFDDLFAKAPQTDQSLEVHPKAEHLQVDD